MSKWWDKYFTKPVIAPESIQFPHEVDDRSEFNAHQSNSLNASPEMNTIVTPTISVGDVAAMGGAGGDGVGGQVGISIGDLVQQAMAEAHGGMSTGGAGGDAGSAIGDTSADGGTGGAAQAALTGGAAMTGAGGDAAAQGGDTIGGAATGGASTAGGAQTGAVDLTNTAGAATTGDAANGDSATGASTGGAASTDGNRMLSGVRWRKASARFRAASI